MMNEESLVFSWGLFANNASNSFKNLWQDGHFTDVILATMDDKHIKAHQVILSSSSNFFKNIFIKNPHPNPLIFLTGINHKELELVMKFIYQGKCNVESSDIEKFLAAGSLLGISGLVKDETKENNKSNQQCRSAEFQNEMEIQYTNSPQRETQYTNSPHSESYEIPKINTSKKDNQFEHPLEPEVLLDFPTEDKINIKSINPELYDVSLTPTGVNLNEKNYSCDKCDYKAAKKGNLNEHNSRKHGILKYKCDQCSYAASKDTYLTVHKKSKHQGIMNECDKCDFRATWKNTLIHHKQVRHEGKWKECEQCEYKTATKNSLALHILSKHKGVRYSCDQCDHVATQEKNLKVHKLRHGGVTEASQPLPSNDMQSILENTSKS